MRPSSPRRPCVCNLSSRTTSYSALCGADLQRGRRVSHLVQRACPGDHERARPAGQGDEAEVGWAAASEQTRAEAPTLPGEDLLQPQPGGHEPLVVALGDLEEVDGPDAARTVGVALLVYDGVVAGSAASIATKRGATSRSSARCSLPTRPEPSHAVRNGPSSCAGRRTAGCGRPSSPGHHRREDLRCGRKGPDLPVAGRRSTPALSPEVGAGRTKGPCVAGRSRRRRPHVQRKRTRVLPTTLCFSQLCGGIVVT